MFCLVKDMSEQNKDKPKMMLLRKLFIRGPIGSNQMNQNVEPKTQLSERKYGLFV